MKKKLLFLIVSFLLIPNIISADMITFDKEKVELLENDTQSIKIIYDGEEEISKGSFTIYSLSDNISISSIKGDKGVTLTINNSNVSFEATNPLKKGDTISTISLTSKNLKESSNVTISKIKLDNEEEANKIIPCNLINEKKEVLLSSITSDILNIEFDSNTYEYNFTVGNDIEVLDLKATSDNSNDKITISDQNLKVGTNNIIIKVEDTSGNSKEYKINVFREKEKVNTNTDKVEINENKTNYYVIIVVSILFIVGDLIYLKIRKNK